MYMNAPPLLHSTQPSLMHPSSLSSSWGSCPKPLPPCEVYVHKTGPKGGGGWHKALVVGSVSLWRRILASRP